MEATPEASESQSFGEFLSRIENESEAPAGVEAAPEEASPVGEAQEVEQGDEVAAEEAEGESVESGESEHTEEAPIEEEPVAASPIEAIKGQIKELDLPPEEVARELGLAVSSREISQLAAEMSKAKELQREAKKGAELVTQARDIISKARQNPIELLKEIAGPNFIDNYLLQQAGIEAEQVEEEKGPDFEEILNSREEQRRQQEIGAVVAPWRSRVQDAAKSVDAPNAVRFLGGREALASEVETLVDQMAIQREEELGRPLTPIEAHLLLQDWTPEKAIDTLEAEARRRLGVSESAGEEPVAAPKQQPKRKPQTLTGEMSEQSADTTLDLDKYESERDRLNAFMNSKNLKP